MEKILRISDKGHPPSFPKNNSKEKCIENFISSFDNNIIIIADNCEDSTISFLKEFNIKDIRRTNLGNSGSLKYAFEICYNELEDEDAVYLCEGDFLHLPEPEKYLLEGLRVADYVTLYDHLDKYQNPSQNPFVKDGGEDTKVVLTKSSHWKYTNSTVQTFATRVKTLREDKEILYKYNFIGKTPMSFLTFTELLRKGRKLVSPLPARATACDAFPSPLVDWNTHIN